MVGSQPFPVLVELIIGRQCQCTVLDQVATVSIWVIEQWAAGPFRYCLWSIASRLYMQDIFYLLRCTSENIP